jgi:hypothetical protein
MVLCNTSKISLRKTVMIIYPLLQPGVHPSLFAASQCLGFTVGCGCDRLCAQVSYNNPQSVDCCTPCCPTALPETSKLACSVKRLLSVPTVRKFPFCNIYKVY